MKKKIIEILKSYETDTTVHGSVVGRINPDKYADIADELIHVRNIDSQELTRYVRIFMSEIDVRNIEVRKGNSGIRQSAMDIADVVVAFYQFALSHDVTRL